MNISFPDWDLLTVEKASSEIPRLLSEAEKGVCAVEKSKAKSFEDFVWRLDDAVRPLWDLWTCVSHMTSVMNSPEWRKVEETFQPQIIAFSLRVGQSKLIYEQMKSLLRRIPEKGEGAIRRRILQKSIQGAERSGVALTGAKKERFNQISARLAKLSMDFANAVIDATKDFSLKKGGKTYTIDDANYPETMKHCSDRSVRESLFKARSVRAAGNSRRITEILALRSEIAKILGYENYAQYSLSSKCAPSAAKVFEMIDSLDKATVSAVEDEEKELLSFASSFRGIAGDVRPWDRAFLAERLREQKYAYSEEELKKCCEFSKVLKGLFKITEFLFGVVVREVKGAKKPSVWHKDVMFFEVLEKSKGAEKAIAHFYFDPWVRSSLKRGGAWMNEFRSRRLRNGSLRTPLAVICTNFPERGADGKSYLPMREVETLYHEFGHALQCMLSRVDEEGASGLDLVEWDAVEVASQFMENWCLDPRAGLKIPSQLKAKVLAAKNFRSAAACRRQLAFSAMDMVLHSGKADGKSPEAVKKEAFRRFGVPFIKEDKFLCAFTHIFAGGYAAGYYGYKWAEVMSADCFGAFEEASLNDDKALQRVGARYRDTILSLGGSQSALEVFKAFRGRDPEIDALLRISGLVKEKSSPSKEDFNRISAIRRRIDAVDEKIVSYLCRRFALSQEMRAVKKAANVAAVDPIREKEIISKVVASVPPADRDTACSVYEAILRGSRGAIEVVARGVLSRQGKVLLCRAKGGRRTYLPGGHVDFGETAREALVREMKEECALDVTVGDFLGVLESTFVQDGKKHCEVNLIYEMSCASGVAPAKVVSEEDWISFGWYSPSEFASSKLLPEEIRPIAARGARK